MIFEERQQKGLSLIETAMVIILSVVFISGGSYIISLFKVFAQSCVVATDMNSVRNIIVSSDVEYKTGKYDASSITNDDRFNKYQVYFGNDGYTLISGNSPVSMDVFFITCYLAKYNCVWILNTNNKIYAKHMSAVLPLELLSAYGLNYSGDSGVTGLLFKRY
ncbi:bundle-forming pilus minor pilin BfpK [Escherichia coli]|uniref:bundle-forming pilus minor pilin BfpK n=1 Tax=Escherichia coli TaxID=562 RepID=UPI000B801DF5|nr:bundle-forming pilus minor pilin BfpK [Escherichia coli]PJI56685.1 hypothetical protein CTU84_22365 [Escherichia coli]PJI61239.1 hypothetical protein CTY41_23365 [Escherichia coli]